MVRKITSVVFVLLVLTASAYAHGGKIIGQITETHNGEPIPYCTVQLEGTKHGTVADSTGRFTIDYVPARSYTLIASAVGFETQKIEVTVTEVEPVHLAVSLEHARVDAGQIVVTGTRTPRYVKDVPVFTEVVSKASIEDKSAANIFEALDGEAGVKVENQCQGCNFTILRMQGLGADHTQVLLDGQPIYSGLAGVFGLQQMSTADVDQIEIVKGAGSALYGSNAVAGAINIISSIPRKTEGKVGIELGEHGTNRYSLTASARKDKLGLFLFAQQSEQDELDETGDANAPGGVDNPDGWIDRVRASSKNAGFNLFLEDVFASDQVVIRGRLMDETRSGGWLTNNLFENPFAAGTERIITNRFTGQVEYQLWLPSGTEINANVSFTGHKRDATNDTFLSDYEEAYGETPPVELLRPYVAEEDLLIGNVNLVQPIGNKHRLLIGVQLSHNELDESGMYLDLDTQEPYRSTSTKHANELGAFVQDEFKLTNRLEVVAGLRFDYHRSEDEFRGSGDVLTQGLDPLEYEESTFNPRFSLKYSVTDALVLRGSAGSGFRVPYGFSEDLHLCSGSPRVYKGGSLLPEKSFSYSFTADYTRPDYTASLNLYRTDLTDAIAFSDADPSVADLGYTYQWENIDNAYSMGVEFNGSISVTDQLVLGARFELFEGKYDNPRGDWLETPYEEMSRNIARYPQTSGGLKADYTTGEWNLVADADYKGTMYIDLLEPADPADAKIHETESFVIFSAKVSRTLFDRYKLYLGMKNITDYTQEEKYIDDAAFLYAPVYGRLVYGGIQVSL
ncbi:TonB-dependent receptor [candidate division GN15 bacterium]|nr:TonB-dependent receptor [candidate division GN15 bacterium]